MCAKGIADSYNANYIWSKPSIVMINLLHWTVKSIVLVNLFKIEQFYDCGFVFGPVNCRYSMSWKKNPCEFSLWNGETLLTVSRLPRRTAMGTRWGETSRPMAIATLWRLFEFFPLFFFLFVFSLSIYTWKNIYFSHFSLASWMQQVSAGTFAETRKVISG